MRRTFWRTGLAHVPRGYRVGTGSLPVASKVRETGRMCMKSGYSRGTWKGEDAQCAAKLPRTASSNCKSKCGERGTVRVIEGGVLVK